MIREHDFKHTNTTFDRSSCTFLISSPKRSPCTDVNKENSSLAYLLQEHLVYNKNATLDSYMNFFPVVDAYNNAERERSSDFGRSLIRSCEQHITFIIPGSWK